MPGPRTGSPNKIRPFSIERAESVGSVRVDISNQTVRLPDGTVKNLSTLLTNVLLSFSGRHDAYDRARCANTIVKTNRRTIKPKCCVEFT